VHRTIFTAARASTVEAPAIQAVRRALRHAAELATAGRDDGKLIAAAPQESPAPAGEIFERIPG
jgi:hypothetical protein